MPGRDTNISAKKDRKKRLSLGTSNRLVRENLEAQGFIGTKFLSPKPSKPQSNLGDNAKKSLLERVKGAWAALKQKLRK